MVRIIRLRKCPVIEVSPFVLPEVIVTVVGDLDQALE